MILISSRVHKLAPLTDTMQLFALWISMTLLHHSIYMLSVRVEWKKFNIQSNVCRHQWCDGDLNTIFHRVPFWSWDDCMNHILVLASKVLFVADVVLFFYKEKINVLSIDVHFVRLIPNATWVVYWHMNCVCSIISNRTFKTQKLRAHKKGPCLSMQRLYGT